MRVATKLYFGFGILLCLLAGLAVLVIYDISDVRSTLGELTRKDVPALKESMGLTQNFSTYTTQAHLYLIDRQEWRLAEQRHALTLMNLVVTPRVEDLSQISDADLHQIAGSLRQVIDKVDQCQLMARSGRSKEALAMWDSQVRPVTETVSSMLDQAQLRRESQMINSAGQMDARILYLRLMSEIAVLVALVVALLAGGLIVRSILRPILKITDAAGRVGKGDFGARVDCAQRDELGTLARAFNRMSEQVAVTIDELAKTHAELEARNLSLSEAQATVKREMELAARIQHEILPGDCGFKRLSMSADMVAATDIGGDFYDVLIGRPNDISLTLVVGDVSGKGIAAALMMVFVVTVLREVCSLVSSPADALNRLNSTLRHRFNSDQEMYLTCFYGILNAETLEFAYAKAGHEEPLWYQAATGASERLGAMGLFVGPFEDGLYEDVKIQLSPGDRLVFYTDGLIEARSIDGEFFGVKRMQEVVERHGMLSAPELIDKIKASVVTWTGGGPPADDMTLLVVEAPADFMVQAIR